MQRAQIILCSYLLNHTRYEYVLASVILNSRFLPGAITSVTYAASSFEI